MDYIYYVGGFGLLFLAGTLLLFALVSFAIRARGYALARKFAGARPLAGKTKTEIIALMGPPNGFMAMPEGKTLHQWVRTGYHIALLFDGDICEAVTYELKI